ncbi:MAG: hypothetical protein LBG84_03590 [Treponema sp.]|jgi:hypothetical protein|nr:hypothetical protein [Treponema sp.]
MPQGADLYISAEVKKARPILEGLSLGGVSGAGLGDFLDMTSTLTAAVFREEGRAGGRPRFYAAAAGKFPSARGGLFFGASRDWEKRVSAGGIGYWYSEKSGLAVFLGAKSAYLSHGDPFAPPPGAESPAALEELRKGAVLSGWLDNPAPAFKRIAAAFGIPLEIPARRLLFGVYPGKGEDYTAALTLETPSPIQAAALVRIFDLARRNIAGADFSSRPDLEALARALFAGVPRQEGAALILKTGTVSGRDLALLFNTISVY